MPHKQGEFFQEESYHVDIFEPKQRLGTILGDSK